MPIYHSTRTSVRLCIWDPPSTVTTSSALPDPSQGCDVIELSEEYFEGNEGIDFLGQDKPFFLVSAGRDLFRGESKPTGNDRRTTPAEDVDSSLSSISTSFLDGVEFPSGETLEVKRGRSAAENETTLLDKPSQSPSSSNELDLCKPIKLVIELSPKSFIPSLFTNQKQDVCINVFFNGELTQSRTIGHKFYPKPKPGVPEKLYHYSGRRIDYSYEVPWILVPPSQNGCSSARDSNFMTTAASRWNTVNQMLLAEANEWGRYGQHRSPVGAYLEELSRRPVPDSLKNTDDATGSQVGIIDVVISVGRTIRMDKISQILRKPQRKLHEGLFGKPGHERKLFAVPEELRHSKKAQIIADFNLEISHGAENHTVKRRHSQAFNESNTSSVGNLETSAASVHTPLRDGPRAATKQQQKREELGITVRPAGGLQTIQNNKELERTRNKLSEPRRSISDASSPAGISPAAAVSRHGREFSSSELVDSIPADSTLLSSSSQREVPSLTFSSSSTDLCWKTGGLTAEPLTPLREKPPHPKRPKFIPQKRYRGLDPDPVSEPSQKREKYDNPLDFMPFDPDKSAASYTRSKRAAESPAMQPSGSNRGQELVTQPFRGRKVNITHDVGVPTTPPALQRLSQSDVQGGLLFSTPEPAGALDSIPSKSTSSSTPRRKRHVPMFKTNQKLANRPQNRRRRSSAAIGDAAPSIHPNPNDGYPFVVSQGASASSGKEQEHNKHNGLGRALDLDDMLVAPSKRERDSFSVNMQKSKMSKTIEVLPKTPLTSSSSEAHGNKPETTSHLASQGKKLHINITSSTETQQERNESLTIAGPLRSGKHRIASTITTSGYSSKSAPDNKAQNVPGSSQAPAGISRLEGTVTPDSGSESKSNRDRPHFVQQPQRQLRSLSIFEQGRREGILAGAVSDASLESPPGTAQPSQIALSKQPPANLAKRREAKGEKEMMTRKSRTNLAGNNVEDLAVRTPNAAFCGKARVARVFGKEDNVGIEDGVMRQSREEMTMNSQGTQKPSILERNRLEKTCQKRTSSLEKELKALLQPHAPSAGIDTSFGSFSQATSLTRSGRSMPSKTDLSRVTATIRKDSLRFWLIINGLPSVRKETVDFKLFDGSPQVTASAIDITKETEVDSHDNKPPIGSQTGTEKSNNISEVTAYKIVTGEESERKENDDIDSENKQLTPSNESVSNGPSDISEVCISTRALEQEVAREGSCDTSSGDINFQLTSTATSVPVKPDNESSVTLSPTRERMHRLNLTVIDWTAPSPQVADAETGAGLTQLNHAVHAPAKDLNCPDSVPGAQSMGLNEAQDLEPDIFRARNTKPEVASMDLDESKEYSAQNPPVESEDQSMDVDATEGVMAHNSQILHQVAPAILDDSPEDLTVDDSQATIDGSWMPTNICHGSVLTYAKTPLWAGLSYDTSGTYVRRAAPREREGLFRATGILMGTRFVVGI